MEYKEMLLLSYFKSHYKKYDFNEIIQLLGVTLSDLNDMIEKLLQKNMLLVYNGVLVLSREAEIFLEERNIPTIGLGSVDHFNNKKKSIDINEVYIPQNFKL